MAAFFTTIQFAPLYASTKLAVHRILDSRSTGSKSQRFVNGFLIAMILLNTGAVILETDHGLYGQHTAFFHFFDLISVAVFTVEYLLRLWSSTCNPKYSHPFYGRLRYVVSVAAIIDLIAIIPFYLPLLFAFDLRFLRMLRMLEFARFLKLGRYVRASKLIGNVVKSKKEELTISLFATASLILVASCLVYYIEHQVQPNKFSSIPNTMWFCVSTLATVGYGDMYPITTMGKILTALISILGIGMFAIPTGILASAFNDEFRKLKKHKMYCPHCGEEIDLDHPTEKKHLHY